MRVDVCIVGLFFYCQTQVSNPHIIVLSAHGWRWLPPIACVLLHLALTYGTYVPSWTSEYGYPGYNQSALEKSGGVSIFLPEAERFVVECGVRGSVSSPQCSAQGFYDRLLFGQSHLGVWMSSRMKECSTCSPGEPDSTYRPHCQWRLDAEAPRWCFAHIYDPEGALSTLPTVMTVWFGVHFGKVLKTPGIECVLYHWLAWGGALTGLGLLLHFAGVSMNKQLWSISYTCFMAGTCGITLSLSYIAVDQSTELSRRWVRYARKLLFPFQAMGMNAIFFFFWHGTAEAIVNAFYIDPPMAGSSLSHQKSRGALLGKHGWVQEVALGWIDSAAERQLVYVLIKVGVYLLVAVVCYRLGYFWKI